MLKEGMGFDFVFVVLLTLSVAYILNRAKQGHKGWDIRRIPGLDAIEEGIGRATEMNRPVFYLPGSGGFDEPQLLASMAVLSEVAKMTARYDTRLIVCVPYSGVYPIMQEIVRQAYVSEGKAESFRPDDVRWFSDHYFGYALGIVGLMFKEPVATNIMIGNFAFDALMYAEAANQAGAIQVGGTAAITQIPFFVAACDCVDSDLCCSRCIPHKRPCSGGHNCCRRLGQVLCRRPYCVGGSFEKCRSGRSLEQYP